MALEAILDLLWHDARVATPLAEVEAEIDRLEREELATVLGVNFKRGVTFPTGDAQLRGEPRVESSGGLNAMMQLLLDEYTNRSSGKLQGREYAESPLRFSAYVHDMALMIATVTHLLDKRDTFLEKMDDLNYRAERVYRVRERLWWPWRMAKSIRIDPYRAAILIATVIGAVATVLALVT